jgi:hypothetical protein
MDVSACATMNDAATCDKRWRAAGPRETSVSGTHHVPAVPFIRRCRLTRPSVVFLAISSNVFWADDEFRVYCLGLVPKASP